MKELKRDVRVLQLMLKITAVASLYLVYTQDAQIADYALMLIFLLSMSKLISFCETRISSIYERASI